MPIINLFLGSLKKKNSNNSKAVDLACLVFQDAHDKVPHERVMAKVNVNDI